MITTLRESKAKLSALVELASNGEEVVITVRGKPKARLCPITEHPRTDKKSWGRRLREARASYSTATRNTSKPILDDLRGERV